MRPSPAEHTYTNAGNHGDSLQLSEHEFTACILPPLSMPTRGPQCKLGYHCVLNLILGVLYTGMPWKCLPIPKDPEGTPAIHNTNVYRAFAT
jgi:hypothetical protein